MTTARHSRVPLPELEIWLAEGHYKAGDAWTVRYYTEGGFRGDGPHAVIDWKVDRGENDVQESG